MLDKSNFKRNIIQIALGSITSQFIVLITIPLLSRLYSPEAFGILALFIALYTVFSGLFTLKYDLSIIIPLDHSAAVSLTFLTLVISLIFSLILVFIFSLSFVIFYKPEQYIYFLLPTATFLCAFYTVGQQWCARNSNYQRFTKSQIINALLNVTTSLFIITIFDQSNNGMVIAFIIGLAASSFYLFNPYLTLYLEDFRKSINISSLKNTALEYKRFPLFVLPSSLIVNLGISSQPLILQSMFSLHEIGLYSIANRLLQVPSALLGNAIGEAFRAEFIRKIKLKTEISTFFHHTLYKILLISIPIFISLFIISPTLFSLLLGEAYIKSGKLAQYLSLGVFAHFIAQPFLYVFIATGHERLGLIMNTTASILPLVGLFVGSLAGSIEQALLLSSLATFLSSIFIVFSVNYCCQQQDRAIIKVN